MDARVDRVAPDRRHGCNTWLVGNADEVIVVDPGRDAQAVLTAASDREILAVICTHGHPEHVAAALEVAARDETPVALHRMDMLAWREEHPGAEPDIQMEEGGIFEVADAALEVLHTPGHTEGSVCLLERDLGRLYSGDTLFAGSFGRVDLPGGSAEAMVASLDRLRRLDDGIVVLPGHGMTTSIGRERAWLEWIVREGRLPA